MGFLAPLASAIGPAIGSIFGKIGGAVTKPGADGGSSILGNLLKLGGNLGGQVGLSALGNKLSQEKPNALEQGVLNNDQTAQNLGLSTGQNLLGMGNQAINPVLNYWSSILSGNRGLATSALAPEISRIGQGYQQAGQTSAALNPRGGTSAEFNAELPFQQQRDVSSLFQQARPQAATQMQGLGTSLLGQGSNALYASTAAGRDILTQQAQMRQREMERGKSTGAGLFSQFQQYGSPILDTLLSKLGKKKPGLIGDGSLGGANSGVGPGY